MGEAADPRPAMVPTEDTMEALMDYLVFPLLPVRETKDDLPSSLQQMKVARQMHAAVILYNYYHRKDFPKLEFLYFEAFCKLSCIAKPGLLIYMRYMLKCEKDLEALNNLSITEKSVLDACNICAALDASRGSPDIEGWPVSKVAVFLVNPATEKCLLQFCAITQGVWSLVEKVLEASSEKPISSRKIGMDASNKKRSSDEPSESYEIEEELEQLAFSAVDLETGISCSDLSILERHVTYSLDHEKTTTRLYIMKYDRIVTENLIEVPITDLISSLKGPIIQRDLAPVTTSVVEHFHILPYIELISGWMSRVTNHCSSSHMPRQELIEYSLKSNRMPSKENHDLNKNIISEEKQMDLQKNEILPNDYEVTKSDGLSTRRDQEMSDRSYHDCLKDDILNSKNNTKATLMYNRRVGGSCMGITAFGSCKDADVKHSFEPNRMLATEDNEMNKKTDLIEQQVNIQSKKNIINGVGIIKNMNDSSMNGLPCAVSRLDNIGDSSAMKPYDSFKMKNQSINDESFQNGQTQDIVRSKDATKYAGHVDSTCLRWTSQMVKACIDPNIQTTKDQTIKDQYFENVRTQEDTIMNNKKDNLLQSSKELCLARSTHVRNTHYGDANQDGVAAGDLPLAPVQFNSNSYETFYQVMESKQSALTQASLRILQKKRDELCQQQRLIADEIAQCEMNIQTILIGEENLTSNFEPIIEALNILCSSQVQQGANVYSEERCPLQIMKRRRISEAIFSSRNPCQELDDICLNNSWTSPRYNVFPSFMEGHVTGRLESSVTVKGMDFECTCSGDLKSSSRDARESAAMHMLKKLHSMADQ